MAAQILSFAAARLREPASRDWSSQELAEFYRVESALLQAGLALESDRGLSDEGDPWFVFCRADTGEVFIHFARVDGVYVVDGAAFGSPSRGRDFGSLVRDLIASHPLATVRRPGSNVMMHPAALLIALVGAAFFHSGKAKAAEPGDHAPAADARGGERRGLVFNAGGAAPAADAGGRAVSLDAAEVAAVLTGVAIGLRDAAPGGGGSSSAGGGDASPGLALELAARAVRALGAPDARDALGALAATDARAALTVMAVFHDLARTPVANLALSAAAPAPASTAVTGPAPQAGSFAAATAAPAPPVSDAIAPLLVVHLAAGALPQIEAVALVSADGALARVSADRVVHVEQLPALLSDLIAHGEILAAAAAPTGAGPSDPTPPDATVPTYTSDHGAAGGVDVHHDAGATTSVTPADTGHSAGSTPAPVAPPSSPIKLVPPEAGDLATPPAPASPAPSSLTHSAQIDAAVLAFVSQVPDVKVMVSGHEVVFYDPAILQGILAAGEAPDSITWRLEDGSSVSLVGTVSELHALHGVG